ncbi:MAG: hypothetical protein LBH62_03750 [Nitrososphaerota archaeon]|nr:hypothetical protein [Nitrososphaerota archaeon]
MLVFTVMSVSAQIGFKPSVPQFTVELVDGSYDVPSSSTTTIDQYTGEKTTTTTPGYHVENKTIEITIKNQPFTPYTGTNGITYYLYYSVQSKGRFGEDWQNWGSTVQIKNSYGGGFLPSSEYLQGSIVSGSANGYTNGAQVDFRVEAIIGHYVPDSPDHMFPQFWFETDESSGWSSVQTITIASELSSSPSQTATFPLVTSDGNGQSQSPCQAQPSNGVFSNPLFMFGVGALFAGGIIVVVLFLRWQPKNQSQE